MLLNMRLHVVVLDDHEYVIIVCLQNMCAGSCMTMFMHAGTGSCVLQNKSYWIKSATKPTPRVIQSSFFKMAMDRIESRVLGLFDSYVAVHRPMDHGIMVIKQLKSNYYYHFDYFEHQIWMYNLYTEEWKKCCNLPISKTSSCCRGACAVALGPEDLRGVRLWWLKLFKSIVEAQQAIW